jgi:hypothetical protein
MTNANNKAISEANQETYDRLIVSIEAGIGSLQIFLAVCDGDDQKAEIIRRYEQELFPSIQSYQVYLDPQEPSLRQTVADTVSSHKNTIVTVLSAEALDQDESLKKFFGYLQWTREALRELHLPIILWVPGRILKLIAKNSPDFWSWCNGVFKFQIESELVYNQVLLQEHANLQLCLDSRINNLSDLKRKVTIETNSIDIFNLNKKISSEETEPNKMKDLLDELEQLERRLEKRRDG